CARPQGAFYAFPNVEGTGFDEHELANRLLNEAGVAVLPGTAFGSGGKGFIRLAYTQSEDELKLGLRRIREFVAENKASGSDRGRGVAPSDRAAGQRGWSPSARLVG